MSILDKVIAAATPPESEEARAEANAKAWDAAQPGDWLTTALEHHQTLETRFAAAKAAQDAVSRTAAFKQLAIVLVGHAGAEETVLYPALADAGETGHANMAYGEQVTVKMQMAALEKLDPMSQDWMDKLEHIEGAVRHHMFEEEGTWFLELKEKGENQEMLTMRFKEEYDRYVQGADGADGSNGAGMEWIKRMDTGVDGDVDGAASEPRTF